MSSTPEPKDKFRFKALSFLLVGSFVFFMAAIWMAGSSYPTEILLLIGSAYSMLTVLTLTVVLIFDTVTSRPEERR